MGEHCKGFSRSAGNYAWSKSKKTRVEAIVIDLFIRVAKLNSICYVNSTGKTGEDTVV